MQTNELESKVHEIEEALNERRDEVARTKISESEKQGLSLIEKKVQIHLEEIDKIDSEEKERNFIQKSNALLHEIRQSPTQ